MGKDGKDDDLAGSDGPDDPPEDRLIDTEPVGGGGGGGPDEAQGTDYHTTRSNNTSVGEGHEPVGGGGGGGPDEAQGTDYHTTRSNNTSVSDGDLVGDGSGDGKVPTKSGGGTVAREDSGPLDLAGVDGNGKELWVSDGTDSAGDGGGVEVVQEQVSNYDVAVASGGGGGSGGGAAVAGDGVRGAITVEIVNPKSSGGGSHTTDSGTVMIEDGVASGGGGDGKVPTKSGGDGIKSIRFKSSGGEGSGGSNVPTKSGFGGRGVLKDSSANIRRASGPHGGGGKGPGIVRKGVGKTLGLAKTMIMTAVLISVAGAGVDVYQTYNDAIAIDLEEHITDADFEMSDDKSEISGSVGFDIPQMGTFEKSIIASVHITVLESNPTTDGDYEFEYTLGSGEHFYDFTLDDLDPVTVEKIEAGQPLDIEYSGTISVTYLGIEIPSITMDIPLTTTIVETA